MSLLLDHEQDRTGGQIDHHEVTLERKQQVIDRWQSQQPAYDMLKRLATEPAESVYEMQKLVESFSVQPTIVACIDERVMAGDATTPKIAIAGTGILMNEEEFTALVDELKKYGITKVTFHGETPAHGGEDAPCGACAAYCKAAGKDDPYEAGREIAMKMMQGLDIAGEPDWAPYVAEADKKLHDARAIIVDGSGRFNPAVLGLPPAFQSSVRYYGDNDSYMNKELGAAIGIAKGHGFGRWFDPETSGDQESDPVLHEPLLIALVGDSSDPRFTAEALEQRLAPTLHEHADMIQVVRLTVPSA
jgi:hypothetical protein